MDAMTLVMYLENPENIPSDITSDIILNAIRENKESLRNLQGSYRRMIENLEALGTI